MTGAANPSGASRQRAFRPRDLLFVLAAVGAIAALIALAPGRGGFDVGRSAIGFAGLQAWLEQSGIAARIVSRRETVDETQVGLRVLPLFDGNLAEARVPPKTESEALAEQDQIDVDAQIVLRKIYRLNTLIVLPKWRSGLAILGRAGPEMLRDWSEEGEAFFSLITGGGRVDLGDRDARGFAEIPIDTGLVPGADRALSAALYLPQVVVGGTCEPLIGDRTGMILGLCSIGVADDVEIPDVTPGESRAFILLSDPDLLNNHGLNMGANAEIAAHLLPYLATLQASSNGSEIVIDMAGDGVVPLLREVEQFEAEPEAELERNWSELFAYPLSTIWATLGVLAVLAAWRGAVRGQPIRTDDQITAGVGAGIGAAIMAHARLLRLSGRDRELLQVHVQARLQGVASEILGPRRHRRSDALEELRGVVTRRDAALGGELVAASGAARALPSGTSHHHVVQALDRFETIIERVLLEFGRTS